MLGYKCIWTLSWTSFWWQIYCRKLTLLTLDLNLTTFCGTFWTTTLWTTRYHHPLVVHNLVVIMDLNLVVHLMVVQYRPQIGLNSALFRASFWASFWPLSGLFSTSNLSGQCVSELSLWLLFEAHFWAKHSGKDLFFGPINNHFLTSFWPPFGPHFGSRNGLFLGLKSGHRMDQKEADLWPDLRSLSLGICP